MDSNNNNSSSSSSSNNTEIALVQQRDWPYRPWDSTDQQTKPVIQLYIPVLNAVNKREQWI